MQAGGVGPVAIEPVAGQLTDHYDPRHKVLRLSEGVYAGRSVAALGIAAHEAGHAIQDASHYPGLIVRNAIVPVAGLGSTVFWILILAGMFLGMFRLIIAGIILFSATVVFQLINLPVEFDASRRARQMLLSTGHGGPRRRRSRRPRPHRRSLDLRRGHAHERDDAALLPVPVWTSRRAAAGLGTLCSPAKLPQSAGVRSHG